MSSPPQKKYRGDMSRLASHVLSPPMAFGGFQIVIWCQIMIMNTKQTSYLEKERWHWSHVCYAYVVLSLITCKGLFIFGGRHLGQELWKPFPHWILMRGMMPLCMQFSVQSLVIFGGHMIKVDVALVTQLVSVGHAKITVILHKAPTFNTDMSDTYKIKKEEKNTHS